MCRQQSFSQEGPDGHCLAMMSPLPVWALVVKGSEARGGGPIDQQNGLTKSNTAVPPPEAFGFITHSPHQHHLNSQKSKKQKNL